MAVKFGTDGTLYCNTVRYNYKQARNIVYNNCAGHPTDNDGWTFTDVAKDGMSDYGLKTITKFRFSVASNPIQRQQCFTPTAGHKYYGSILYKTYGSSFSTGDSRFEWWCNDTDLTGKLTFADKISCTNYNWVRLSSIQTAGSSMASGSWYIRNFFTNPSTMAYCTQLIIIDLTDTFGSGNEPTQAWCDANILEYTKITGLASSYSDSCVGMSVESESVFSWNVLNSNWEPRDRMNYIKLPTNAASSSIRYNWNCKYSENRYYIGVDVCDRNDAISLYPSGPLCGNVCYKFYFPYDNYKWFQLGNKDSPLSHTLTNGGGGMKMWKRISTLGDIGVTPSSSNKSNIMFSSVNPDRKTATRFLRLCHPTIISTTEFTLYYKLGWGTSNDIFAGDLNNLTLDRMMDGRYNVIIHIKDPSNTQIKFNAPIQKVIRTITTITYGNANAWAGIVNDSWSQCTNTSELTTGLAYFDFTESTNNKLARFVVNITSISGSVIYTNNLGWGYVDYSSGAPWYQFCEGFDIQCNDIEIHPEINYISFDKTGTIKCKKLVTNF